MKKDRKKICFVTTVPGTLKAFVLDTADYLHHSGGFAITFICDEDDAFGDSLPEHIEYKPIQMKRGINLYGIKAIIEMYRIFRKEKYSIVQYSTPNASLYASVASKFAGIPNRLYCQWGIVYVSFSGIKRWLFKRMEKIVCMLSTVIEPDSKGNLQFSIDEKLYSARKGRVIWNGSASGVNLERFNINKKEEWREEIKRKLEISSDKTVIGFVGRINKDKGINELLEAAQHITKQWEQVVFILIGGKENCKGVNQGLLSWLESSDRAIYVGQVEDVYKYYASMDIFVLPSYREGFGTSIIEAQAMGVPVITTNIPGPKDAMIDGHTGYLVEKKQAQPLIEKITLLLEDDLLRKNLGKNGLEFTAQNFDSIVLKEKILADREALLLKESLEEK